MPARDNREIDFIAEKWREIIYSSLFRIYNRIHTYKREFASLKDIKETILNMLFHLITILAGMMRVLLEFHLKIFCLKKIFKCAEIQKGVANNVNFKRLQQEKPI
jgi:hypothetical protein